MPAGYPCYEHNTLTDQLDSANLKWRYYGYATARDIWNTPNAIQHICQGVPGGQCQGTHWTNGDVDLNDWDIFTDLGITVPITCNLRAVSWVIPNGGWSDHPGYDSNQGGPDWVADIVNAVGQSTCTNPDSGTSYWNSTAIFVVWDDWGGFYDHVPPYEVLKTTSYQHDDCKQFGCGYVAGFRVPLLVVSAYTGTDNNGTWSGYISGQCQNGTCGNNQPPYWHDFGSILNFIQYVFSNQGMVQGDISTTQPNWQYDDAWAPDYYGSPQPRCTQQQCPFALSDFFGNPTIGYFKNRRSFTQIPPQTYQPGDYTNLNSFGGLANNPPDDEETP